MKSRLTATLVLTLQFCVSDVFAQGAAGDKDISRINPDTEAHYQMCLKEAHLLQQRYAACTTEVCRGEVKKDFDTWTSKCFKS